MENTTNQKEINDDRIEFRIPSAIRLQINAGLNISKVSRALWRHHALFERLQQIRIDPDEFLDTLLYQVEQQIKSPMGETPPLTFHLTVIVHENYSVNKPT